MDIKSFSDVQKQTFQKLLDKLIARNKFTAAEAKNFQALLENDARDPRNVQTIMEKIKDYGSNILIESGGASPDASRFDDGQ